MRLGNNGAPEDRKAYAKIVEELGVKDKKGGQLRREFGNLLKEGKTVPFPVVYSAPVRPVRNNAKKKNNNNRRLPAPSPPSAKLLGGETIDLTQLEDARQPLMEWLRDANNPLFAKAFVNRVWASYFHVGIVDPPDDLSLANPPSNAALLEYLAAGFIEHDFDMKWVHREILNSDAYQRSWQPNESNIHDKRNFSRAIPRRLPAEAALDAIASATVNDQKAATMLSELKGRAIALAEAGPATSPQRRRIRADRFWPLDTREQLRLRSSHGSHAAADRVSAERQRDPGATQSPR